MNKQAIIYSPFNLDSCFAAVILKELALHEKKIVSLFPYTRSKKNTLPEGYDEIFVMGADVKPIDLTEIIENNKTDKFMFQAYPNSEVYATKIWDKFKEKAIFYSRFTELMEDRADAAVNYIPSVSLVALALLKENGLYTEAYSELAQIIHKFCDFQSLNQNETYYLYDTIQHIQTSLTTENYVSMTEWSKPSASDESYDLLTKQTRSIILDNMSMAWYLGANGSGLVTPTINVASANAMLAMRFINYSHNDVISYEDTRDCRVYRILSQRSLEWYKKRFEPTDFWSEGTLVFLKTELPRHVR
jgi:hypothetical protein